MGVPRNAPPHWPWRPQGVSAMLPGAGVPFRSAVAYKMTAWPAVLIIKGVKLAAQQPSRRTAIAIQLLKRPIRLYAAKSEEAKLESYFWGATRAKTASDYAVKCYFAGNYV